MQSIVIPSCSDLNAFIARFYQEKNVGYISKGDYFLLHKYFMISIFHVLP